MERNEVKSREKGEPAIICDKGVTLCVNITPLLPFWILFHDCIQPNQPQTVLSNLIYITASYWLGHPGGERLNAPRMNHH